MTRSIRRARRFRMAALGALTLAGSHTTYGKKGCNPLASGCSAESSPARFHYLLGAYSHVQAIEIDVWTMLG